MGDEQAPSFQGKKRKAEFQKGIDRWKKRGSGRTSFAAKRVEERRRTDSTIKLAMQKGGEERFFCVFRDQGG